MNNNKPFNREFDYSNKFGQAPVYHNYGRGTYYQNDILRLERSIDNNFDVMYKHINILNYKIDTLEKNNSKLTKNINQLKRNNNKHNKFMNSQYGQNMGSQHRPLFKPCMGKSRQMNTKDGHTPDVLFHISDAQPLDKNGKMKSPDISSIFGPLLFGNNTDSIFKFGEQKKEDKKDKKDEKDEDEEDDISIYDSDDEFEELNIEINNLDDLIDLGKMYDDLKGDISTKKDDNCKKKKKGIIYPDGTIKHIEIETNEKNETKQTMCEINGKRYSINLKILNDLIKPLKKLQALIGLDEVKNKIIDKIVYYVQGFEKKNRNMLHTIIEGPPGVGKTEIGKILAEIYAGLGVLPENKFKIAKRTDLIGKYLGHSAKMTQEVIDDAEGGVLFIDEAYALGNEEKKDSFAKECIDTLNLNLTEKRMNLIVVIAGYPDELDKCFFSYNPGLKRRFPFRLEINGYQPDELKDIFLKKVNDSKWKIENEFDNKQLLDFFTANIDSFPYYGGDIENLLVQCKFMHSRRVVGKHPKYRYCLTNSDIIDGLEQFKNNKKKNGDEYMKKYIENAMFS